MSPVGTKTASRPRDRHRLLRGRNPRLPVPAFFCASDRESGMAREAGARDCDDKRDAGAVGAGSRARHGNRTCRARNHADNSCVRDSGWKQWTAGGSGRVLGEAMFGEAKARAAKRLAEEMRLDLGRCYAYGDSLNDRWLMAAVGRPAAVNSSKDLADMARTRGWPVLNWERKESPTQRRRGHGEVAERKEQLRVIA